MEEGRRKIDWVPCSGLIRAWLVRIPGTAGYRNICPSPHPPQDIPHPLPRAGGGCIFKNPLQVVSLVSFHSDVLILCKLFIQSCFFYQIVDFELFYKYCCRSSKIKIKILGFLLQSGEKIIKSFKVMSVKFCFIFGNQIKNQACS